MRETVLVAGGAGFLGGHLCYRLVGDGHRVIVVDDLSTGVPENLPVEADLIVQDIARPLTNVAPDRIINLACPASPPVYQADPIRTIHTAVLGAMNLLELASVPYRRAPILTASTSEVYGDPTVTPQPETYWGNVNPVGIRACYDESKRLVETLFAEYRRTLRAKTTIVRIFNTYGPRMRPDDGRVVSNFITQALVGESLTVYGSGNQTRSLCYVDDMTDALVRAAWSETAGPVNLGNPHEVTMLRLAEMVLHLTGSASTVEHRPLPADDPTQRCPDIRQAWALLGWEPHTSLQRGLETTISYFRGLATAEAA